MWQIDLKSVDTMDKDRDTTIRGVRHFRCGRTILRAHYVHPQLHQDRRGFILPSAALDPARRDQRTLPIEFQFTQAAAGAKLEGSAKLKRLDFGAGQGDWKSTEWVADAVENKLLAGAEAQDLKSMA